MEIIGAIQLMLTTESLAAILFVVKIMALNLIAEESAHGTGESA